MSRASAVVLFPPIIGFTAAVTENALKWHSMERRQSEVDYPMVDAMLDWTEEFRIPLRATTFSGESPASSSRGSRSSTPMSCGRPWKQGPGTWDDATAAASGHSASGDRLASATPGSPMVDTGSSPS